jgi:D-alanine-D-alanine ligase
MKKTHRSAALAWLKSRRVAVLKGGWSRERPISLKTGAAIEASLKRLGVKAVGIDVKPSVAADLLKRKINFAYIALHGEFGEDGRLQNALDVVGIPYTGSGAISSALAMDKVLSKEAFVAKKVPTPAWAIVKKGETVPPAVRALLKKGRVFVKPSDQGSAIGAAPAKNPNELSRALKNCFRVADTALVERHIDGRELTVGILGKKALPVVEIVPEHSFYDFHSKYAAGGSRHLVPAPLSRAETRQAQRLALRAFNALNCSAYGRVDLMFDARGKFYVLEVNTIPGMTNTSLLPDAAKAAGLTFDDLVVKIVELSRHA